MYVYNPHGHMVDVMDFICDIHMNIHPSYNLMNDMPYRTYMKCGGHMCFSQQNGPYYELS